MKVNYASKILLALALTISIATVAVAGGSPFDIQTQYLEKARTERVLLDIAMMSGEKLQGYVKSFDAQTVLVDSSGDLLLYKHAISSITSADGNFRLVSE